MRSAPLVSDDNSIMLRWTIYLMADTSAKAPFTHPVLNQVVTGNSITVPDSLLRDNRKIYVELVTTCANKVASPRYNAFVKRFNQKDNCYHWGEQAF